MGKFRFQTSNYGGIEELMAMDELGIELELGIEGIQKALLVNQKALAGLRAESAPAEAIQYVMAALQRYAISPGVTPVDTGALRASHRVGIFKYRGVLFLDPTARNPRSGVRTAVYGAHLHARGGRYAFYERTVKEAGEGIMRTGLSILDKGVTQ